MNQTRSLLLIFAGVFLSLCLWRPGSRNPHDFVMAFGTSIIQYEMPRKFILLYAPSHIALPFQMQLNLFNTVV